MSPIARPPLTGGDDALRAQFESYRDAVDDLHDNGPSPARVAAFVRELSKLLHLIVEHVSGG